ncbi:MAG: hypothetical protein GTO41_06905, partial [Burkholderiales bacterium]|nr:hypothetical protein [Burkholderiales bacterium]
MIDIATMRHTVFSGSFFITALVALGILSTNASAQDRLPRLGFLALAGEESLRAYDGAFFRKLESLGWVEGKNVEFVFSTANNDPAQYPQAAARLVQEKVHLIYAESAPAVRAAHAATRTIPTIASDYTNDPVAAGYAISYRRPGGNITGIFLDAPQFAGKWIELLKSLVPGLTHAVVLWDPTPGDTHVRALEKMAPSFGLNLEFIDIKTPEDIDAAASAFRKKPGAIFIVPSPMMFYESARLARLARKERVPAISMAQQFAEQGGLLAYGPEQDAANARLAVLAAKILDGADPADLPIEKPDRFEL